MREMRVFTSLLVLLALLVNLPICVLADEGPELTPIIAPASANSENDVSIEAKVEINTSAAIENVYVAPQGSVTTNEGTITGNKGIVITNEGVVVTNENKISNNEGIVGSYTGDGEEKRADPSTGNVGDIGGNTGTVTVNNGDIFVNGQNVVTDENGDWERNTTKVEGEIGGTVEVNNHVIDINKGTVNVNEEGAYIGINCGIVDENKSNGITDGPDSGIWSNSGTVKKNDGVIRLNITLNHDSNGLGHNGSVFIGQNSGTVGTNSIGTVDNITGGKVEVNFDTVNNGTGGEVEYNYGHVINEAGGEVLTNYGITTNSAGGIIYDIAGGLDNGGYIVGNSTPITEEGVFFGVGINRGGVVTESEDIRNYQRIQGRGDTNWLKQIEQGGVLNLKEAKTWFNSDGYELVGYLDNSLGGDVAVYETEYRPVDRGNQRNYITLLWRAIKEVISPTQPPSVDSPSIEVPATPGNSDYYPSTIQPENVKVGSIVKIKNQKFKIIEADDGSILVATMANLSMKELKDIKAFLTKYFTEEQIAKLLSDPELMTDEMVADCFGDNRAHFVFRAPRDFFAK